MTNSTATANPTYTMTVELSVLESLGINLYSNAAAVLSELVANAYDADAGEVRIAWEPRKATQEEVAAAAAAVAAGDAPLPGPPLVQVVVNDDGCGMSVAQLNERFLTAGYKKRANEGTQSPKGRPFMGRKGIGKLSVFSLARTVEVYSKVLGGTSAGFRIVVDDLEEAIKKHTSYHPVAIAVPAEYDKQGTTLVLSDLRSQRAHLTSSALRKRLARRFDVLDPRPPAKGGFHILVNGSRITYADRQELKKLEFIWEFGKATLPGTALPTACKRFILPDDQVDKARGWKITGWIGTTPKPTDLVEDEEAGSLKNIIVLARKRPIQEGILEKLDFSRVFGSYVTGQIEAEFLDLDDAAYEDIATSDRQRLIEDDERVLALQAFLRKAFNTASEQWGKERPKKEAKDAMAKYPKLKAWVESRPDWQRPSAEKMIGTIAALPFESKNETEDRNALFRSGILAFERVGLRHSAVELEALSSVTAVDLLPLLGHQEAYEAGLWVDILRSRISAIEQLQAITDADQKEAVLQEHLFKNLWLLDASWERATTKPVMEENLRKIDPVLFAMDEKGKEITGRVDIRYATISGRHVIVELKRYGVKTDVVDLVAQGTKYRDALASILEQQNRSDEILNIQVIFVLGQKPGAKQKGGSSEKEYFRNQFAGINGDFQLYDQLIDNARTQYEDYLQASAKAKELDELLTSLGGSVKTPKAKP